MCVICSDILEDGITVTRCGHLYHDACIEMWLFRDMSCPQCRCRHPAPRRVYPITREPNALESERLIKQTAKTQLRLQSVEALLRREKSKSDLLSKKLLIAESVVLYFKKRMMRYRRQALIAQDRRTRELNGDSQDNVPTQATLEDNQLQDKRETNPSDQPESRCLRSQTARIAARVAAEAATLLSQPRCLRSQTARIAAAAAAAAATATVATAATAADTPLALPAPARALRRQSKRLRRLRGSTSTHA